MSGAKDLRLAPIRKSLANQFIRRHHYSHSFVRNSQIHIGVFYRGALEGVMQLGPPMARRNLLGLVQGTPWNGFLELNRMAFTEALPRNSESRALAVLMKLLRRRYRALEWIVSFADGTQCGDGTIYRAAGFVLTGIKKNKSIIRLPDGRIGCKITYIKGPHALKNQGSAGMPPGAEVLTGYQFRYLYFLNPGARARLTCREIPYSEIQKLGAGFYKGEARAK